MASIVNADNAMDEFPCDVCGKIQKGYEIQECFVPGWAWKGRPAGYDDPNWDHSGFELSALVDHGAGLGHGLVCRACYAALYGAQGPQCYPFERRTDQARAALRRHGVKSKGGRAALICPF